MAFRKVGWSFLSLTCCCCCFFFFFFLFFFCRSQFPSSRQATFLPWTMEVLIRSVLSRLGTTGKKKKKEKKKKGKLFFDGCVFGRHFTVETHEIRRTTNPVWNATFKIGPVNIHTPTKKSGFPYNEVCLCLCECFVPLKTNMFARFASKSRIGTGSSTRRWVALF
jgi:hypothetical protein